MTRQAMPISEHALFEETEGVTEGQTDPIL